MKTLKLIIPVLALVLAFNTVKADDKDEKLTKTYAVSIYVDAVTNGKFAGLNEVIDDSAKFNVLQSKKQVHAYSKKEMLAYMNANLKNIKQLCIPTTTLITDNTDVAVLKVDMKYTNFTRSDYVTMTNTGNGWKITNVCSVCK